MLYVFQSPGHSLFCFEKHLLVISTIDIRNDFFFQRIMQYTCFSRAFLLFINYYRCSLSFRWLALDRNICFHFAQNKMFHYFQAMSIHGMHVFIVSLFPIVLYLNPVRYSTRLSNIFLSFFFTYSLLKQILFVCIDDVLLRSN